jgi:hypothetical protein
MLEPVWGFAAGYVSEIAAVLAVGLLLVSSGIGANAAQRVRHAGKNPGQRVSGIVRKAFVSMTKQSSTAILLALPAFFVVWQAGASFDRVADVGFGIAAAVLFGALLGFLFVLAGIDRPAGVILGSSAAVAVLWPASLGWIDHLPTRFPGPDAAIGTVALLLIGLLTCAVLAARYLIGARRVS